MSMWSDFDLTDRQLELVGRATELGPAFAARAAEIDRDARFPHENYADMRSMTVAGAVVSASPAIRQVGTVICFTASRRSKVTRQFNACR